jgi:hypothetical protein
MRRFAGAVALAVVTAGCFGAPGTPDSIDIEIPDAVVRGAPGSVHVLRTVPVAPQAAGRVCAVAAQGINNDSVHPNSDLLVRSDASEVVIPDVERAPSVRTEATGPLTLGSQISVAVRLGPDEVFSGGLVVELDCAPRSDLNRQVSGPFTGTSFQYSDRTCNELQLFDAMYEADAGGVGTLRVGGCVLPTFPWAPLHRPVVGGSWFLTAPNGATLTGLSVTGTVLLDPPEGPFPLDFTLTVAGGTEQFAGVTGTIGLDGTWDRQAATISGTLVGSLQ